MPSFHSQYGGMNSTLFPGVKRPSECKCSWSAFLFLHLTGVHHDSIASLAFASFVLSSFAADKFRQFVVVRNSAGNCLCSFIWFCINRR